MIYTDSEINRHGFVYHLSSNGQRETGDKTSFPCAWAIKSTFCQYQRRQDIQFPLTVLLISRQAFLKPHRSDLMTQVLIWMTAVDSVCIVSCEVPSVSALEIVRFHNIFVVVFSQ